MQFTQHGLFGNSKGGYDVFLAIGDSIIAGFNNGEGPGTSPVAGTTFQSNGSAITAVVNDNDFTSVTAGNGSPLGQFCFDYYNFTGRKIIMVPRGFNGSDFVFENNADHWATGGNLYQPAVDAANDTLALVGVPRLTGILLSLGTNDSSGVTGMPTVTAGIDSLFDRLVADFPGVPILVIMPGAFVTQSFVNNQRNYQIRWQIRENVNRLQDVYIVSQLNPFVSAGLISADDVHLGVAGDNMLGSQAARWFRLSGWPNKFVRGLLCSFFDDLSTARKTVLQTYILAEIANGNYLSHTECFYYCKGAYERNSFVDWTQLGGFLFNANAPTFIANDCYSLDGVNDNLRVLYQPEVNTKTGASYQDIFVGVDIKQNSSAGVVGRAFGWSDASASAICLTQAASSLSYQVYDLTGSVYSTDTSLQAVFYSVRRVSSTGKNLDKGFSNVNSVSVTALNPVDKFHNIAFGAMNSDGTLSQFLALKIRAIVIGRGSTFDGASFKTNYDALDTNW